MLPQLIFIVVVAIVVYGGFRIYQRGGLQEKQPHADLTDEQIKQQWRKLGFFCELDTEKRVWTLTGSRAGLLYFPDLLLGYVNDPKNAESGHKEHFGPYGSLEIMTYPEAGFDGHAIRGSLTDLERLASLVEEKLALAQPGEPIRIREEFAAASPYTLQLNIRADGFDPAVADRESLGAVKDVKSEDTGSPGTRS